jgi:hypothetical protein
MENPFFGSSERQKQLMTTRHPSANTSRTGYGTEKTIFKILKGKTKSRSNGNSQVAENFRVAERLKRLIAIANC